MGRYAIYRYLLRVPDVIFTQTRQQQALLEENHDLQSTLIGNGHPVPDPDFKKETPPVVLWLSSLKRVKNPETFIRLFEATEDLSCQFWIVGRPVNEEVHEYVQQKADQHEKLEYLGGCGVQESNEYFKKASVYVHTGGSEGFPNTFIQSWLHRTPVVSFSTDPDSAIKNNTIGVRCKSIKEAKETITQMIEDPEYCGQISMNAREYGINNHSIEKITDRIERRLETLIEETHNTETE
nr:glycosyltransferase [Halopiger aswanensis]